MNGYRKLLYGAIVGAATFLGGCQGAQTKEGLQEISHRESVRIADLTPTPSPAPLCPTTTPPPIQEISIQTRERITLSYPREPRPQTQDLDFRTLDLSIRPAWETLPAPRGFDLASVTFDMGYQRQRTHSLQDLTRIDTAQTNQYGSQLGDRYDQSRQNYSSKLGIRESRILLEAAREIIREMAYSGYRPMIHINHFINDIERIGEKLQAIERGFRDIYTINFGNLEEEFTDPLGPLKRSIGVEGDRRPRQQSRINIEGTLEPTLGGHPFGTRSGQDLADVLQGKKEADLGFMFRLQIDF